MTRRDLRLLKRSGDFYGRHDADDAVEVAAVGHGVDVRAGNERRKS